MRQTTASGTSSTAIGAQAQATQAGATAMGWQSTASAERAQAFGHLASATGVRSTAVGEAAQAQGEGSVALGNEAVAAGANDTVAVGNKTQANGNSTTVLGGEAFTGTVAAGTDLNAGGLTSTGDTPGATAIGWRATATAERAQAFGHLASASGIRSTAIGEDSAAQGAGSVSLGNKSVASGTNSIAIGNGANAAGDNQIVLGNAGQLQASTASQSGGTNLVTTDANGTLGTSVSIDSLATSQQFSDLRRQYNRQEDRLEEAEDGIAMALSMETPVIPSGKRYAMGFGTGYYNGSTAVSASFAGRATDSVTISAGAGVGADTGKVGARGGVTFAW